MADCIKVAVRIRPLVKSEEDKGCQPCVDAAADTPQLVVRGGSAFTFNYVFDSESTQQLVYEAAVQPLITKLFQGYNVTILAYGQTGSGKTHTMGSNCTKGITEENHGIIFRAVREIFQNVFANDDWSYKITASFMELYMEQLYDLLAPSRATVDIREDTKGIFIPDLTEKLIENPESAMQCLIDGSVGRVTGATAMNMHSSRSHAIFTLTIQQHKIGDPSTATTAKFHLVDLAGSERCKKTQAEGDRFKEGVTINAGLLALGNVIAALGEGGRRVPSYRTSKLTRLLQDSLGGNSYTLMIACISPADFNMSETISTLRYADRVRRIKNRPVVNQDPKCAEIAALKKKVEELQLQLLERGPCIDEQGFVSELQEKIKQLEAKLRSLTRSYNENLHEIATLREAMLLSEVAHERMKERVADMATELEKFEGNSLNGDARSGVEMLKKSFSEKLLALQNEQLSTDNEMRKCESIPQNISFENNSLDGGAEEQELFEEQHVCKQNQLNQELRELQQQLAVKTVHCEQVTKTSSLVADTLKENIELKNQYEKQIADLEHEKNELLASIKQLEEEKKVVEVKAKHAELSKKNAQIELLHKKLAEQSKIVRQKEAAEKKVALLSSEIQQMKQAKVRLIKQMKEESERLKAYKAEKARESKRLVEQDRKRQNEMQKLQSLHQKQIVVSKRKLEEAVAVNKRLKDALSLQKAVRAMRDTKNPLEHERIHDFIAKEVEDVVSAVDAERTLEAIMEHRATLTQQLASLRRLTIDSAMEKQIASLQEELELRNLQISDFQQRLVESEERDKQKSRWDILGTMAEAKKAVVHAVKMAAEIRREALQREASLETNTQELMSKSEEATKRVHELEGELLKLRQQHELEIMKLERDHQEALEAIRPAIEKKLEQTMIISEQALNDTINEKEKECEDLKNQLVSLAVSLTPKLKRPMGRSREYEDLNISDDVLSDDATVDPDWRKTPLFKRVREIKRTANIWPMAGNKRTTDGMVRCGCRSRCDTKRCVCVKMNQSCGENCICDAAKCRYKLSTSMASSSEESTINTSYTLTDANSKRRKTIFALSDES